MRRRPHSYDNKAGCLRFSRHDPQLQPCRRMIRWRGSPLQIIFTGRMPAVTTLSLYRPGKPTRRPTFFLNKISIRKARGECPAELLFNSMRSQVRILPESPDSVAQRQSTLFRQILVATLSGAPFSKHKSSAVNAGDTPFMLQVRDLPESPDSVAQPVERNVSPSPCHRFSFQIILTLRRMPVKLHWLFLGSNPDTAPRRGNSFHAPRRRSLLSFYESTHHPFHRPGRRLYSAA